MFAYIDETGHTGSNLFDSVQPIFYYGVFSCKVDFDFVYGDRKMCIRDSRNPGR